MIEGSTGPFAVTMATEGGACVGEAHVITVSGEANGQARVELDHALAAVYERGGANVAVDISALESADEALDVLLVYLARFRARGGDVVVACADGSRLASDIRVERRIDEAVASLLG